MEIPKPAFHRACRHCQTICIHFDASIKSRDMYVSADGGCALCALILKSFEEKGAGRGDAYNITRSATQPTLDDVGSMWEPDGDRIEKVSRFRYELTWESDRNRIENHSSWTLNKFIRESDADRKIKFSLGIYTSEG